MGVKIRKNGEAAYSGSNLNYIAFPMGGTGAGMICLEGGGGITSVSTRHRPEIFHQPCMFSAFRIKGAEKTARVLEGQIPDWKVFAQPGAGNGLSGSSYGFPRCAAERFSVKFPFATVRLAYPGIPLKIDITGWSPFIPGDEDSSGIPAAGIEFTFINNGSKKLQGIYSFNSKNFLATGNGKSSIKTADNGFVLHQSGSAGREWEESSFCATIEGEKARVNCRWLRGPWFDPLTAAWQDIESGLPVDRAPVTSGEPSPGASLYVPVTIPAGGSKTVRLLLSWYTPYSNLRSGNDNPSQTGAAAKEAFYRPWYAGKFRNIGDVSRYWAKQYVKLKKGTERFTDCFYSSSMPPEIIEAAAANLAIFKSPTMLRQHDGRLWCWEGCCDSSGCCAGSCTHVWNYAQATAHLFPRLERSLRQTEFNESQDERGHQSFRAWLPIRPTSHASLAASDGQLGGIMKVYRDWRISGDHQWLKTLWPRVKQSLDYCIATWDPEHRGILKEPHHNT